MTNLPDSTYKKGSAENFKWSNNLPCDILLLSLKQNKAIYHMKPKCRTYKKENIFVSKVTLNESCSQSLLSVKQQR